MDSNITRQLEAIRLAIENSGGNDWLTVSIPILVVFIGAFIAHIFNLIEKKRLRENLRSTVVFWLKESIQPITIFIETLQQFVDESKSATVLESRRLFTVPVHLHRIREFPIDKLSEALVARLKVGKEERTALVQNFYDLYDSSTNISDTINRILEAHSDYNEKMNQFQRDWDKHFMTFSRQIKDFLIHKDIVDIEMQCFIEIDSLITDLYKAGGVFRRDILHDFIQGVTGVFGETYATERINQAAETFHKNHTVFHYMEGLLADAIDVDQTHINLLNASKAHLSEILSFYEGHRVKGILSFSNKIA